MAVRSSAISQLRIQRGDRIGIVGPNGSGKTTLINMLTGVLPPDTGSVRLGSTLAIATLDQHRDSLDPDVTVAEALTEGHGDTVMVNGNAKHVVSYMKDFLFASEQARTPLGKLSGGERGRLMLARVLAKPSNLLVLDEPTNDLDMETLDVLEEMLAEYPGTVLLISHDRDFLDRLVSGVIVPEGDGRWIEYAGGYSDMLAQRDADLTRESFRPQQPRKAPKESAAVVTELQPAKRRLLFKDKHALETLPKTIATLQDRNRRVAGKARRSAILCARSRRVRESLGRARRTAAENRRGRRTVAGARNSARGACQQLTLASKWFAGLTRRACFGECPSRR